MKYQLRIGVIACDCGGEITDVIAMNELMEKISHLGDVVLMEKIPYGCTPDGEETIQQRITGEALNRLVLLGCSPRIMEKKFQKVCQEAGLNPSLLEIVNLRDQCAWVHQTEPDIANSHAWDLIRMGIAKSRYLTPTESLKTEIHPDAVVIGGGIAGMTSALSLANRGIKVKLVEKEHDLGGTAWIPNSGFPSIEINMNITQKLIERVEKSGNIDVFTETEPVAVSGSYGNYEIKLKVGKRTRKIECGVFILAIGAEELKPYGYYEYGKNGKVITQRELEKKVAEDPSLTGLSNIVMIQCAGARNEARPYCGRTCCLEAVNNSIVLKEKKTDLAVTILHRDIPTEPGPDGKTVDQARELGVEFIRFAKDYPPEVTLTAVTGKSQESQPFKLPYDLVVLSTPLVPNESFQTVADMFQIPVDQFGFFPDARPNLKPHQVTEPCIHVVGSAH